MWHRLFKATTTKTATARFGVPCTNAIRPNLPCGQRIVSRGDVHGDVDQVKTSLVIEKVMDPDSTPDDPKWIGVESISVQICDILDRDGHDIACIHLLATLAQRVEDAGGSVYLILKNHEVMNLQADFMNANKDVLPNCKNEHAKTSPDSLGNGE